MATIVESDDAYIVRTGVKPDIEVDVEGVTKYQHQAFAYFIATYEDVQVADSTRTWMLGTPSDEPQGIEDAIDEYDSNKATIKSNIAAVIAEYQ